MSDHLTVGDVIDALSRYDRDRIVATSSRVSAYPVRAIASVEPSGAVLIVEDIGGSLDPMSCEWREYQR